MKKTFVKTAGVILLAAAAVFMGCTVEANPVNTGTNVVDPTDNDGDDPVDDNGGDEDVTIGKFYKTFPGAGVQIWPDGYSFTINFDTGVIGINAYEGWWGGAIGGYGPNGADDGTRYNLSSIDHITFNLSVEEDLKEIWFTFGDDIKNGNDTVNSIKFKTGDAEAKAGDHAITVPKTKINTATSQLNIIALGGGGDGGKKISITNLAFWDENNAEVVPTIAE